MNWIFGTIAGIGLALMLIGIKSMLSKTATDESKKTFDSVYNPKEFRKPRR